MIARAEGLTGLFRQSVCTPAIFHASQGMVMSYAFAVADLTPSSPHCILVFGGTFDPPHLAHAILPAQAARQSNCDVILYVPAAINPLKSQHPVASNQDRLAMLLLATADVPGARISTVELDRPGPSYMIDTLRALHAEYSPRSSASRQAPARARSRAPARAAQGGGHVAVQKAAPPESPGDEDIPPAFRLLIGCDQALDFHRWKDWQQILTLATPAVMLRPPWDEKSFHAALDQKYSKVEADSWKKWTLRLPMLDLNATEIRDLLQSGGNEDLLRERLDPAVLDYIRTNNLYGADRPG